MGLDFTLTKEKVDKKSEWTDSNLINSCFRLIERSIIEYERQQRA
jgi:hypothetical protein